MALNYELTGERIQERIDEQPELYNALIWASLGVDLDEISDKNAGEFVHRCNKLELTTVPLTLDMVKHFIGLKPNVANLTRNQLAKKHNPLLRT